MLKNRISAFDSDGKPLELMEQYVFYSISNFLLFFQVASVEIKSANPNIRFWEC